MAERETSKVISSGASDRVLYAIGLIALFGQVAINAIDHGDFGFPKRGWLVAVLLGLMPLIGMMWVLDPDLRRGLLRSGVQRRRGRGREGRRKAGGRVGGRPGCEGKGVGAPVLSGA